MPYKDNYKTEKMRSGEIIAHTCKITFNQKPSTVEFLYRGLYTAFDNKQATSA